MHQKMVAADLFWKYAWLICLIFADLSLSLSLLVQLLTGTICQLNKNLALDDEGTNYLK